MEFHTAANIFPLDDEHIDELAEDIQKHGQLCPIEILDDQIIDGRRRWIACQKAGVEPEFVDVAGQFADPIAYVLSLNMHRRHLTPSQRSMVAARARQHYDDEAKERMLKGKKVDPPANLPEGSKGDSRDKAGQAVGVSGKLVDAATKVLQKGVPRLVKAVDEGRMAVTTAAIVAHESEEVQEETLDNTKLGRRYGSGSGGARVEKETTEEHKQRREEKPEGELRGVGILRANEAVNALSRIPKNDALRKRGFQLVSDWIKTNR